MVMSMMTITVVSMTAMPASSRLDVEPYSAAFMGRYQSADRVVSTATSALAPTRRPGTGAGGLDQGLGEVMAAGTALR
jgi:hypothetical protein